MGTSPSDIPIYDSDSSIDEIVDGDAPPAPAPAPVKTESSETEQQSAKLRSTRAKRISASKYVPIFARASFSRLVREIARDVNSKHNFLWTPEAMLAVQEAVEMHLHQRFHMCDGLLRLCRKKTISKDIFEFLDVMLTQCAH